jgi:kinesin family protein 6/9
MKSGIEVFIRARPTDNFAYKSITVDQEKNTIAIHIPKKEEDGIINHQQELWNFKFDKILMNETQEHIFEFTGKRAVSSLVDGISCSLVTYGQTGAGKTFTVIGLNNDYRFRGLIPRAISQLFHEINAKTDCSFKVKLNFIEIYNENINDLLNKDSATTITLQEDPVYGVMPKGSVVIDVHSEEEALALMFHGETNRTIREHSLNKLSSRSHALFTIILEARSKFESKEKVTVSKLNIIDLAGSERSKKTLSQGGTLLEASFINKSLSYLEQLVVAYSENK